MRNQVDLGQRWDDATNNSQWINAIGTANNTGVTWTTTAAPHQSVTYTAASLK